MFGISDYSAFVVAVILFLMIPGPGNLALITSTGKGGIWAGMAVCLGCMAADQVLMWLAVAGVAAVMTAYPAAFQAVQWIGAIYLAWIGYKLITAKPGDQPVIRIEPRHYFKQGFLITLMNPKAIVFYMAFFPLFVDPTTHRGFPTFALMAATVAVISLVYCTIVVLITRTLAERLRANPSVVKWLEKTAGVFLIGFGLKLALTK